ncbi:unnamed protein product [Chrysodeixis includens]|uniref:Uncharacterized protein n=1 Tax=Chrysodeixis includens TaxID=689277 RepID=A0A9N8L1U1_CHRIL|nr:unnamed protein product [Chrysodeixis includens]
MSPDRFRPRRVTMTPASYAGHIIVHKRERKHRCSLCSFTLIARWDGNPTRPERDQAQESGPTFLRAFQNTKAVIFICKPHTTFEKSVRAVGIDLDTFDLAVLWSYH